MKFIIKFSAYVGLSINIQTEMFNLKIRIILLDFVCMEIDDNQCQPAKNKKHKREKFRPGFRP